MAEVTMHVTLKVPKNFNDDEHYEENHRILVEAMRELAEKVGGTIYDLEIK